MMSSCVAFSVKRKGYEVVLVGVCVCGGGGLRNAEGKTQLVLDITKHIHVMSS